MTSLRVEIGLLLARHVLRLKNKDPTREMLLQHVHLHPPEHQHLHQLFRPYYTLPSQSEGKRGTPPCGINRYVPNLSNIEKILGIGSDHIEVNDTRFVCESIWECEGGVMVSPEVYRSVGIMRSYLLFRVEAVDEVCAGELRLGWWGLLEAAYYALESVGDVDDGCAWEGSVEVLC